MKIKVLALGKLKEKFLKDGINEFTKRLTPYTSYEIVEITPIEIHDENTIQKVLSEEGEKILSFIKDDSFVITLEIQGKQLTSEEFADKLNSIIKTGISEIVFVIGSSHGLSQTVTNRADFKLSLSRMTFLHQFARLILTEQIYRAFKIIKGEKYHK